MLRIFKNFRKQEVVLALFSVVFVVAQVWLELKLPDYMREITSLITTQDSAMHDILIAGGKMLLCAFGSLLVTVLVAVCASRIASNFSAIVRGKLFDKVQSFSMEEIGRFSTASLITRSTNDVTQVQMLIVMGLSIMLRAPIMAVMAILKIVDKSWQWTLSTGVAVVVLLIVVIICVSLCMPKFKRLQSLTDDINQVTRENLTGLNVVRAYNAEAYQEEKFEKVNKDLTDTHWFTSKTMAFMMPNGNEEAKTLRINPEMHIPEASSAIHGIYDADDYDDHEWPFACNILDWRGFDQRCTGYAGKIHIILGYGCIFLVCNAGCHVVHDAGYDIYYAAAGIGCSEAYFGSIRY